MLQPTYEPHPGFVAFISGIAAGIVSRTMVSPLERIKIIFQVQDHTRTEYRMSVQSALAKIWREERWKGFMRGNGTNCIRVFPYTCVQLTSFYYYEPVSILFSNSSRC